MYLWLKKKHFRPDSFCCYFMFLMQNVTKGVEDSSTIKKAWFWMRLHSIPWILFIHKNDFFFGNFLWHLPPYLWLGDLSAFGYEKWMWFWILARAPFSNAVPDSWIISVWINIKAGMKKVLCVYASVEI